MKSIQTKRKAKKTKNVSAIKKSEGLFSTREYESILADLKQKIRESQLKAVLAANRELIHLYWIVSKTIVERQEESGWGTKFIEKLAKDIQKAFPGIEGFSRTNVLRMRAFYIAYQNSPSTAGLFKDGPPNIFLSRPWIHNLRI